MASRSRTLSIGGWNLHEIASSENPEDRLQFVVRYGASRKLDKKEASGKGDATITDKGREVREIRVTLTWPNSAPMNRAVQPMLRDLSPANAITVPWDWAHDIDGFDFGSVFNVRIVVVEKLEMDDQIEEGTLRAELEIVSWVAQPKQPVAGKTYDDHESQPNHDDVVEKGFSGPPNKPPTASPED